MTNKTNQKNKDILTLIRLTTMQPEQLKLMLPVSIVQAISFSGKNANVEEVSSIVILNSIRKKTLQIINSLNFSYKFC